MAIGEQPRNPAAAGFAGVADEVTARVAPVSLAAESLLPVPPVLAPLFPGGGLQRGWSIGVTGTGGWSVALTLLGAAIGTDGWTALVGLEDLGLVAADELGLQLDRVLMVTSPGSDHLAQVLASLIEVVDAVGIGGTGRVGTREARRLSALAREQNAVLLHFDGGRGWPQPLDVMIEVAPVGPWVGIGPGHGHVASRPVAVTATGRRQMTKPRRIGVLAPGPSGGLEPMPPVGSMSSAGPVSPVGSVPSVGSIGPVDDGTAREVVWPAYA